MKNYFKKEKIIISATNFAREILNIDENLWVFINNENHFISSSHSGLYDKEYFLIRFNSKWLKNASQEKIIKCAFHEVFHAFQHQEIIKRIIGFESLVFNYDELDLMEKEFDDENYNLNNWESYLVEKQAEEFSNKLYCEFKKNFKSIEDFMNKYYLFI